jgi:hypothetical protein
MTLSEESIQDLEWWRTFLEANLGNCSPTQNMNSLVVTWGDGSGTGTGGTREDVKSAANRRKNGNDEAVIAQPCGVRYHAKCIRAGSPFVSRLAAGTSLVYPHQVVAPHFVCELCSVRVHVDRELGNLRQDFVLLLLERMRMIDFKSYWSRKTLEKYGPKIKHLQKFEALYGVTVLQTTTLIKPPCTPSIPLRWAELQYSTRTTKGKDGNQQRIKYATVWNLRSAAAWYYNMDLVESHPQQVMRDRHLEPTQIRVGRSRTFTFRSWILNWTRVSWRRRIPTYGMRFPAPAW